MSIVSIYSSYARGNESTTWVGRGLFCNIAQLTDILIEELKAEIRLAANLWLSHGKHFISDNSILATLHELIHRQFISLDSIDGVESNP